MFARDNIAAIKLIFFHFLYPQEEESVFNV